LSFNNATQENHLIEQILTGQRDKYAELVVFYQNKIIRLCLSFLRNPVEADEAAHDVFIKAYKSLGSFRGESRFSTWLYRIAVRHCQDILRKKAREKTDSWEQLIQQKGDKIHDLFAANSPPVPSEEDSDLIRRLLSALKPETAQILTLREVQGFSYQEMAQILDCSLDAVKARLKRARQEIQKKARHFLQSHNVKISEVSHES